MKHVIIIFCHLLRSRKVSNSNIEKNLLIKIIRCRKEAIHFMKVFCKTAFFLERTSIFE